MNITDNLTSSTPSVHIKTIPVNLNKSPLKNPNKIIKILLAVETALIYDIIAVNANNTYAHNPPPDESFYVYVYDQYR